MIELAPFALVVLYFVPFMVAAGRNHDMLTSVLIANVLIGWTVIGWFILLAWASMSSSTDAPAPIRIAREGALGIPEARRVKDPSKG
jgi:hypothetical protein